MCSRDVVIGDVVKKYENPIAELVQVACQFSSSIILVSGSHRINAKSIMGIMAFNPSEGKEVVIEAEGADAENAADTLGNFLLCK